MSNIGLVQNISCVEDTLSTLLVYTNLNTEVKLQTDLKTKYSVKIGMLQFRSAYIRAATACLRQIYLYH